jgi:anthranilate synthase component 1
MYQPDEKEYLRLCKEYKSVPVSVEWPSDTETPITVYAKVAGRKTSFLLESVEGGEKLGRYSFIGVEPHIFLTFHQGLTTVAKNGQKYRTTGDPFLVIESVLKEFHSPAMKNMPRFYGGAVGYLGYDMVRSLERLPDMNLEEAGVPDCVLMVPAVNIVIDHLKHTIMVVVNTLPGSDGRKEYRRAVSLIDDILARIEGGTPPPALAPARENRSRTLKSNISGREYMDKVEKAREYIRAGDILQVVLSRRIDQPFTGDPFMVYRRLRRNNPSPYLYYLNMGDVVLAGSSPEMLVRVEDNCIETRPIAGTRPRGASRQEDSELARDLLSDTKERAEHLMLVDLGRNDVGRVSIPGTVKVPQFMEVEMYSHVMHLVSSVKGTLREDLKGMDALKACFPAGTVSGAPKVRSMEIIEELEPSRRGPYAGAVGYIGFNGNVDTAIAIRTIVFHGGIASVQVGAGIVADSDPAGELAETGNKARALLVSLAEEDDNDAADH